MIAAAWVFKRSLIQRLFTYGSDQQPAETKETEIGDIPVHWGLVSLEEVLDETQYGINNRAELKGIYPGLRLNNFVAARLRLLL
jgi:restriction endonuclease S subunit